MKAKILIVEDEEMLRNITRLVLETDGYEVAEAADAQGLRQLFPQPPPALVVLDLELPDADGLSLLPEIKQHWPATRILILTGHGTVEAAESAYEIDDVFLQSKPLDAEMLKAMVAMALVTKPLGSTPSPPGTCREA